MLKTRFKHRSQRKLDPKARSSAADVNADISGGIDSHVYRHCTIKKMKRECCSIVVEGEGGKKQQ
uniref:Uncharacterized protein n=1 Tax=Anguilla anguilla TaxID=7936 RepID=A0A0E9T488_ANGAN